MNNELKNLDYCNQALKLKKGIELNFIVLGEFLLKIRDEKLYEGQWDSFLEYLEDMSMTEATATKIINIFKTFVLQYNVPREKLVEAGGWTKLYATLPLVKSKSDANYWITQSALLSIRDLSKEVKERETGIEMRKCKHKNTYTIKICRDCGDRQQVHEN